MDPDDGGIVECPWDGVVNELLINIKDPVQRENCENQLKLAVVVVRQMRTACVALTTWSVQLNQDNACRVNRVDSRKPNYVPFEGIHGFLIHDAEAHRHTALYCCATGSVYEWGESSHPSEWSVPTVVYWRREGAAFNEPETSHIVVEGIFPGRRLDSHPGEPAQITEKRFVTTDVAYFGSLKLESTSFFYMNRLERTTTLGPVLYGAHRPDTIPYLSELLLQYDKEFDMLKSTTKVGEPPLEGRDGKRQREQMAQEDWKWSDEAIKDVKSLFIYNFDAFKTEHRLKLKEYRFDGYAELEASLLPDDARPALSLFYQLALPGVWVSDDLRWRPEFYALGNPMSRAKWERNMGLLPLQLEQYDEWPVDWQLDPPYITFVQNSQVGVTFNLMSKFSNDKHIGLNILAKRAFMETLYWKHSKVSDVDWETNRNRYIEQESPTEAELRDKFPMVEIVAYALVTEHVDLSLKDIIARVHAALNRVDGSDKSRQARLFWNNYVLPSVLYQLCQIAQLFRTHEYQLYDWDPTRFRLARRDRDPRIVYAHPVRAFASKFSPEETFSIETRYEFTSGWIPNVDGKNHRNSEFSHPTLYHRLPVTWKRVHTPSYVDQWIRKEEVVRASDKLLYRSVEEPRRDTRAELSVDSNLPILPSRYRLAEGEHDVIWSLGRLFEYCANGKLLKSEGMSPEAFMAAIDVSSPEDYPRKKHLKTLLTEMLNPDPYKRCNFASLLESPYFYQVTEHGLDQIVEALDNGNIVDELHQIPRRLFPFKIVDPDDRFKPATTSAPWSFTPPVPPGSFNGDMSFRINIESSSDGQDPVYGLLPPPPAFGTQGPVFGVQAPPPAFGAQGPVFGAQEPPPAGGGFGFNGPRFGGGGGANRMSLYSGTHLKPATAMSKPVNSDHFQIILDVRTGKMYFRDDPGFKKLLSIEHERSLWLVKPLTVTSLPRRKRVVEIYEYWRERQGMFGDEYGDHVIGPDEEDDSPKLITDTRVIYEREDRDLEYAKQPNAQIAYFYSRDHPIYLDLDRNMGVLGLVDTRIPLMEALNEAHVYRRGAILDAFADPDFPEKLKVPFVMKLNGEFVLSERDPLAGYLAWTKIFDGLIDQVIDAVRLGK